MNQTIVRHFESDFFQCFGTSLRARGLLSSSFSQRAKASNISPHDIPQELSHSHTHTQSLFFSLSFTRHSFSILCSFSHTLSFYSTHSLTHTISISILWLSTVLLLPNALFYDYYSHSCPLSRKSYSLSLKSLSQFHHYFTITFCASRLMPIFLANCRQVKLKLPIGPQTEF